MHAPVIMLASGKGGTGKSTVAAVLGGEFALEGRRVLLVEASTGLRSLDYLCGVSSTVVYDLGDILSGRCQGEKAIVQSDTYKNLFVVCASYDAGLWNSATFCAFVASMRESFDLILLDVASGMGEAFTTASTCSTAALLIVTPDAVAVRDGRIAADTLSQTEGLRTRLLLTRVPKTLLDCGVDDLDACIDTVGLQLIGVLPENSDLHRAGCTGQPLPAGSLAKRCVCALASRIFGREVPLIIA